MSKASLAVLLVDQHLLVSQEFSHHVQRSLGRVQSQQDFCKGDMKSIPRASGLQVSEETSRVRGRTCFITGKST